MYGITERSVKNIFWNLVDVTLKSGLALPDIQLYTEEEMDDLFETIHANMDPFYQHLYGAFKDPSGRND